MTPSSAAEATKPSKKPLSPKQWGEIEELWRTGSVTYGDLVKKYNRSVSTFSRHFKEHGIIKGSKAAEIKAKAAAEVARVEINDATILAARVRETKEDHYKMAAALSRLTWAEVLEAKKGGRPMSTALNNLKALDAAAAVLKKTREERFAVLGLDRTDAIDPDAIPELVISELTPEQVQKLRDRDHLDVEDGPVAQATDDGSSDDQDIVSESE